MMTRRSHFHLITTTCRRCGTSVATGNRSLFGLDALKAQYDRICPTCFTAEEEAELLHKMGEAIAERERK